MNDPKLDRTWLCSVVFMDVVGYSSQSVQVQMHLKHRFNGYLSEAIKDVPENDRVILDTGDGAAICFLGAPESAMFCALKLRNAFVHDDLEQQPGLRVRIGVNLGPLKLVRDINGNLNAIGEGINTGQRVMSFAGENKILVSRSFYEVVSCLSDSYDQLFRFEGVKKDKHVREHLVYELVPPGGEKVAADTQAAAPPPTAELAQPHEFDHAILEKLQAIMLPLLGPIARHLVKNEALKHSSVEALIQGLTSHFTLKKNHDAFVSAVQKEFGVSQPPSAVPVAVAVAPISFDARLLEKARLELARHIGPMAKLIVDRTAKQARTPQEFYDTLCAEIPSKDRERFRALLGA